MRFNFHSVKLKNQKKHPGVTAETSHAHRSPGAIEINPLNVVVVSVAPVHGTGAVVQRQAVGPQHVGGHEDATVGSVHPGLLDAPDAVVDLVLFPVCPVHPAATNTKPPSQTDLEAVRWTTSFSAITSRHAISDLNPLDSTRRQETANTRWDGGI